jgi:hypothetical protein
VRFGALAPFHILRYFGIFISFRPTADGSFLHASPSTADSSSLAFRADSGSLPFPADSDICRTLHRLWYMEDPFPCRFGCSVFPFSFTADSAYL